MPKASCDYCNYSTTIKHYEVSVDAEEAVKGDIAGHITRNHPGENVPDGFEYSETA